MAKVATGCTEIASTKYEVPLANNYEKPRIDGIDFLYLSDTIPSFDAELFAQATDSNVWPRDCAAYSTVWIANMRRREEILIAGLADGMKLYSPESIRMRTAAVTAFWEATLSYNIAVATAHLSVWILDNLLAHETKSKGAKMTSEDCAVLAAVSFRMASKFEERPEALWALPNVWKLFPSFAHLQVDRSESHLNQVECECMKVVHECLDYPLRTQLLQKYILVGGWPKELAQTYASLGNYLLALSTFWPSTEAYAPMLEATRLAMAAVVLSVKIANGDGYKPYEYFPQRLSVFCQYDLKDLKPTIRCLSAFLRSKPTETEVLGKIFPEWGVHEWQ